MYVMSMFPWDINFRIDGEEELFLKLHRDSECQNHFLNASLEPYKKPLIGPIN